MRRLCVLGYVGVLFFLSVSSAVAQTVITGIVRDSQGLGIPGVTVSLSAPSTEPTVTDESGSYRLVSPAPGDTKYQYGITCEHHPRY